MGLRPLIPVIISTGGGGKTLSLFPEKPSDGAAHRQRSKFPSIVEVNTTLELSTGYSNSYNPIPEGGENFCSELGGGAGKKRKLNLFDDVDDPLVFNPTPLQWYMPEGGKIYNLGFVEKGKNVKKRMNVNKRKKPRRNDDVNVDQIVAPAIEEFPEVMQAIESLHGSRPEFLYSKKLEDSDVEARLNRLFWTDRDALVRFLNPAEVAVVDTVRQGLPNIVGVDQRGKKHNLTLNKWNSLNITVIISDWNKMVAANNAKKGDLVHIWGFRLQNGNLGLVVVFKKP